MNILTIIILIVCILILIVVSSTMKISSRVSRIEEAERKKLGVKESKTNKAR